MRAVGLLTRSGEGPRASEAIDMLQTLNGGAPSPLVLAALGRAHLERFTHSRNPADLTAAESYASRAAKLSGHHPRVRALLGAIYKARGDLGKASAELQTALTLEPDANDILLALAEVYADMGKKEKAQAAFDYVLQIHPNCAACLDDYGSYYSAKAGKPETAAPLFERAIALDPENTRFRSHLAVALMKLGRYGDAVPVLQAGIRIRPTGSALTNLGYCEYLLGRGNDAARHFADATSILPEDFSLWGNLGDALRLVPERHAEAAAAFERAIALSRRELQVNPKEARVHAMLGEYLAKHGDVAEADRELAAALALQSDSEDVLVSAAAIAAIEGKKSDAVAYMRRATAAGISPSMFGNDPQFNSLRSDAKFLEYIK
jgi:serine/threonine-protein kinase